MERIREAVEIAKANRNKLDGNLRRNTTTAPASARKSSAGFDPSSSQAVRLDPKHLRAMRIVTADLSDARVRGFEMLRTQVVRKMGEGDQQTVGITSPTPGCGKTLCALNLAFSIARLPERSVTLIDLDLRKPQVANYLGLREGLGVDDFLRGRTPLEDIVIVPDFGKGRLRIVPNYQSTRNAAALLATSQMAGLIQALRALDPSGIVLIDLPPVLAVDDVVSFLPQLDSVLLLVSSGETTVSEIVNSERLLGGTEILGIVLNKSREKLEAGYTY